MELALRLNSRKFSCIDFGISAGTRSWRNYIAKTSKTCWQRKQTLRLDTASGDAGTPLHKQKNVVVKLLPKQRNRRFRFWAICELVSCQVLFGGLDFYPINHLCAGAVWTGRRWGSRGGGRGLGGGGGLRLWGWNSRAGGWGRKQIQVELTSPEWSVITATSRQLSVSVISANAEKRGSDNALLHWSSDHTVVSLRPSELSALVSQSSSSGDRQIHEELTALQGRMCLKPTIAGKVSIPSSSVKLLSLPTSLHYSSVSAGYQSAV